VSFPGDRWLHGPYREAIGAPSLVGRRDGGIVRRVLLHKPPGGVPRRHEPAVARDALTRSGTCGGRGAGRGTRPGRAWAPATGCTPCLYRSLSLSVSLWCVVVSIARACACACLCKTPRLNGYDRSRNFCRLVRHAPRSKTRVTKMEKP
jgi:hypothetical protein